MESAKADTKMESCADTMSSTTSTVTSASTTAVTDTSERVAEQENLQPSHDVAASSANSAILTPACAVTPHSAISPSMDSVHIAQAAHNAWIASAAPEPAVDPDIAVVDAHHHLWFANAANRAFVADYMLRELAGRCAIRK